MYFIISMFYYILCESDEIIENIKKYNLVIFDKNQNYPLRKVEGFVVCFIVFLLLSRAAKKIIGMKY